MSENESLQEIFKESVEQSAQKVMLQILNSENAEAITAFLGEENSPIKGIHIMRENDEYAFAVLKSLPDKNNPMGSQHCYSIDELGTVLGDIYLGPLDLDEQDSENKVIGTFDYDTAFEIFQIIEYAHYMRIMEKEIFSRMRPIIQKFKSEPT